MPDDEFPALTSFTILASIASLFIRGSCFVQYQFKCLISPVAQRSVPPKKAARQRPSQQNLFLSPPANCSSSPVHCPPRQLPVNVKLADRRRRVYNPTVFSFSRGWPGLVIIVDNIVSSKFSPHRYCYSSSCRSHYFESLPAHQVHCGWWWIR